MGDVTKLPQKISSPDDLENPLNLAYQIFQECSKMTDKTSKVEALLQLFVMLYDDPEEISDLILELEDEDE